MDEALAALAGPGGRERERGKPLMVRGVLTQANVAVNNADKRKRYGA